MTGKVASAETDIDAPRSEVWRALTDPDEIEKYMFGSRVETDWKPGSPITWKGEYEGKKYEDEKYESAHGRIVLSSYLTSQPTGVMVRLIDRLWERDRRPARTCCPEPWTC